MKKKIAILGVVFFLAIFAGAQRIPEEMRGSISQCGINSLYSCFRYLGVNIKLEEMYSQIKADENNMVNLYQLAQYAKRKGLHVRTLRKCKLSKLKKKLLKQNSSILLHYEFEMLENIKKSHLVALVKPREAEILVLDFPIEPYTANEDKLTKVLQQSKGMLILSTTPFKKSMFMSIIDSSYIWIIAAVSALFVFIITLLSIIKHPTNKKSYSRANTQSISQSVD